MLGGLSLGDRLLEEPAIPLALLVAVSLGVVCWNLRRGSRDLFSLDNVVALAMLPLMALGGFTLRWLAPRPEVSDRDLALALCVALAGLIAFIAGYHSRLAPQIAARLPLLPDKIDQHRRRVALAVLIAIAAAGWLVFVQSFGGLGSLLGRMDWATRHSGGRYGLICAIFLAKLAFLIWYAGRLQAKRENVPLLLGLLCLTIAVVFTTGIKSAAADLLLSALILRHYLYRRVKLPLALGGAVALSGLLLGMGVFRITGGDLGRLSEAQLAGLARAYFQRECYGPRMLAESVHRIPAGQDFLYGRGMVAAVTVFIPRWLYPDKPEGTGAWLTRSFFPLRYRIGIQEAPSAITELYANFGLPGVLGGMWLLGVALGALYRYYQRRIFEGSAILYAINVAGLLSYLRSDITGGGAFWTIAALPALLALVLMRSR